MLMSWYGGEGAATVFEIHGDTIFMEWLDGGTLGDPVRAGHDAEGTIAICTSGRQSAPSARRMRREG